MDDADQYILQMEHISKYFPGVRALDDVHFGVRLGEIHGLVGENGSGKSTLIKVLTGIYHPDDGKILFDNKEIEIESVDRARSLGIAVIHQELSMAGNMTVAENIFMGRFPIKKRSFFVDVAKMEEETTRLLNLIGLDEVRPDTLVKTLNIARQHMVEICRALSQNARLLVMDEPTASLSNKETETLLDIMCRLKSEGVSILFVSHKLNEIYKVCDRITVLRDGQYVGTEKSTDLEYDRLINMMVGHEISTIFPQHDTQPGEKFFEANHIQSARVNDVSFYLRKGEILGFYGLVGAGRSEVFRALFGIDKNIKGDIWLDGKNLKINSPVDAVNARIVFAPENRKLEGLILKQTVDFNITISILKTLIHGFSLNKKLNEKIVSGIGSKLKIKTPSFDAKVANLSGGNQQKVVLAKWLVTNPKILILDEATRGIDVGAKLEIYHLVYEIVKMGVSVIFISSEMPEIINMCDRVYIMNQGEIVATVDRQYLTEETLVKYALGGQ
jgi:ABC-type sugar transport system ATPase subunit